MRVSKVVLSLSLAVFSFGAAFAQDIVCWFPPGSDGATCKLITDALGKASGLSLQPRVGIGYPEILKGLSENKPQLAYVGSFVSAVISVQGLGTPLVQKIDGRELYAGVMVFPKGEDPQALLKTKSDQVAYSKASSSGESCAKAATGGQAAMPVKDHLSAANAVKTGNAKFAFVKSYWWADNKAKFPELDMYVVPGVSDAKNPDNILWASKAVSTDLIAKLISAAKASATAFGAREMRDFDIKTLAFSRELMKKAGLDPKSYAW